jgi:hypothetical protein
MGQCFVAIGVVTGVLAGVFFVAPGLWGRYISSWGVQPAKERKKIGIVVGPLGFGMNAALANAAVSVKRLEVELLAAGYDVEYKVSPNEETMIRLLNEKQIVLALGHGPMSSFDEKAVPIGAIRLGGTSVHDDENEVRLARGGLPGTRTDPFSAEWISANELSGNIHNPDLVFVVPGCLGARTDRLYKSSNAKTFVGSKAETNSKSVQHGMFWLVDYLNSGEEYANEEYLRKSQNNVVNAKNDDFV